MHLRVIMRLNPWIRSLALLGLLAGTGCVIYAEPPPPRRVVVVERPAPPPPPPPAPAPAVVITEDDEVHYVVYREYFGCTDEEIHVLPYYRRYYAVSDDDLYFIYFVSRRSNVGFDACFHSYYYDCGRSYDRMVVAYNVPREHFFVSVGVGVNTYPPVYQRTYACYNSGSYASVTFTNTEYVALVHMRVACDYQGHPPATYFAKVQATGSTSKVIVQSRDQCGHGGQTAVGAKVTVSATRAWTLPPQQKQAWHQEHQEKAQKSEVAFKEVHKEQVQKVQAREKTQAAKAPSQEKPGAARTPPQEKPGTAKTGSAERSSSGQEGGESKPKGAPKGEARPDGGGSGERAQEKRPPEKRPPPEARKKDEEDREKKGGKDK
jgi:hypothetical protein